MSFIKLKKLIPEEYPAKNRKGIEDKLNNLDQYDRILKIASGNVEAKPCMFKKNREVLVQALKDLQFSNTMVLLKGNEEITLAHGTGNCFQQESYFYWTFGVTEPGYWGAIDVSTGMSYLFYNAYVDGNKIISTTCSNPSYVADKYSVHRVMSSMEMKLEIVTLGRTIFLVLDGMDEEAFVALREDGIRDVLAEVGPWMSNTILESTMRTCRLIKSEKEDAIMRLATNINSDAIMFVMRNLRSTSACYCVGAMFELYVRMAHPHAKTARPPICLSGRFLPCTGTEQAQFCPAELLRAGDLCLLDMGVEVHGYRVNIVATVPVSGKYSKEQVFVHNIVHQVRDTMLGSLKPGITLSQLEDLAHRKLVKLLILNNILDGKEHDLIESGICKLICPNGVGHFVGIDLDEGVTMGKHFIKNLKNVCCYGQKMKPGMILAVNSELYFNEASIKSHIITKIETGSMEKYFGIVARMQDIVAVTSDSCEVVSYVPRTVKEVESLMEEKNEIKFRPYDVHETSGRMKSLILVSSCDMKGYQLSDKDQSTSDVIRKSDAIRRRSGSENEKERKCDIMRIIEAIMKLRGPKELKYEPEVMREVYEYPYEFTSMLDKIMIPLTPRRRRPRLIPYPNVGFLSTAKHLFPLQGFGVPHFGWIEAVESCDEKEAICSESQEKIIRKNRQ